MISIDFCRRMAAYNGWMNDKLYAAAAQLDDEARKRDRGAFFGSIHGTLDHLLYGDEAWMRRFTGRSLDGLSIPEALFDDFALMHQQRTALDRRIVDWVEGLTPEWLASDFRYYSLAYRGTFVRPAWLLVAHMFNHGTHHRGQVTTLLMQAGIDPGVTDLPAMPDLPPPV